MYNKGRIQFVKEQYPCGTKVKLIHMNDPYAVMPEGLNGTVSCVDDIGTVFVDWENGSKLGVVLGEDVIQKV
jgi:hypothetical protein